MQKHESQTDGTKGFGGKFGVQTDRQDKAAVGFDEDAGNIGTTYEKNKPAVAGIFQLRFLLSLRPHFTNEHRERKSLCPKIKI